LLFYIYVESNNEPNTDFCDLMLLTAMTLAGFYQCWFSPLMSLFFNFICGLIFLSKLTFVKVLANTRISYHMIYNLRGFPEDFGSGSIICMLNIF